MLMHVRLEPWLNAWSSARRVGCRIEGSDKGCSVKVSMAEGC